MRFIGNNLEREKRWMSAGLTGPLTDVKVCARTVGRLHNRCWASCRAKGTFTNSTAY
jgi:hypothetical protein